MANSPRKSGTPLPGGAERRHAQDAHEGAPHSPEEFDTMNPAKLPGVKEAEETGTARKPCGE